MGWPFERDGVRSDEAGPSAADDGVSLAIDASLEKPVRGVDEVVAVGLRVKADNARAEHALEQSVAPRADPESFRVRPRNVPEHDDRRARQAVANEPGRECEVVVLDQHDRIVRIDFRADRVRESPVDRLIVLPVLATEDRARVRQMTQRPEALVGESVVVALLLFGRQPQTTEEIGLLARRHGARDRARRPCPDRRFRCRVRPTRRSTRASRAPAPSPVR